MSATIDFARYMQVLEGRIAYIAERSNAFSIIRAIRIPVIVDIERMPIAVERATVSILLCPAYSGIDANVGLKAGINPIAMGI